MRLNLGNKGEDVPKVQHIGGAEDGQIFCL
jgi:hypothetical protein